MKTIFTIAIFFIAHITYGQNSIEWSPEIEIQFSDFQSSSTEINESFSIYSIRSGTLVDFAYAMSNAEFMFTKNFNTKVTTIFNKKASYISAPNEEIANQLVKFGQMEFDLAELFARKLRKKLYESKGVFSSADFFKPLYDQIMEEHSDRYNALGKSTDMGRNAEVLVAEREKIKQEIEALSDYCKTCKPPKKRKRRK